jgi:hypothetical protein
MGEKEKDTARKMDDVRVCRELLQMTLRESAGLFILRFPPTPIVSCIAQDSDNNDAPISLSSLISAARIIDLNTPWLYSLRRFLSQPDVLLW